MEGYGFQESYIATCRQLYSASSTYYMTIHGNTAPIHIHKGTLPCDTLSPFLFTIFMEPLLRWLVVGSKGYRPSYQPHKSTTTIITYDDHNYADDVSITAGPIQNLKIQLKKINLFSQYTGLQLETTKRPRQPPYTQKPSGNTRTNPQSHLTPGWRMHLIPSPLQNLPNARGTH